MSTLVVKLVGIFVKQLSKPLANQLSKAVIANEALRKSTVTTARALHRFNVWVAHYGDQRKFIVGELVEEKAVQLASSVVTETFIYSVAAATVYWEYQRGVAAAEQKKAAERREREAWEDAAERQRELLIQENREQFKVIDAVRARLERLEREVEEARSGGQSWWRARNRGSAAADIPLQRSDSI